MANGGGSYRLPPAERYNMSRLFDPNRVYDDAASAPHTPGQRMPDHRGWEFMFVLANTGDITQHHTCVITSNGTQARHTTTGAADVGRPCGVPFLSIPRRSLGWLCIWGIRADQRSGKLRGGRPPLHD